MTKCKRCGLAEARARRAEEVLRRWDYWAGVGEEDMDIYDLDVELIALTEMTAAALKLAGPSEQDSA